MRIVAKLAVGKQRHFVGVFGLEGVFGVALRTDAGQRHALETPLIVADGVAGLALIGGRVRPEGGEAVGGAE